jgi:hypothetical protein
LALQGVGVEADSASPEGLRVRRGEALASLGLGSLSRVLGLAPPEQHPERLRTWALEVRAALDDRGADGRIDLARLVPRLLAASDPRIWSRPLAPGLHLALAIDAPLRQRLLSPFDLPRLGLSLAAAQARAIENLRAATPAPETDGCLSWWALGDGLDASRMLLAGGHAGRAAGVIALAPARDLCAFLPWEEGEAQQAAAPLRRWAEGLPALPYPLSVELWWLGARGEEPVALAGGPRA